jgi:hypothetical protein
MLDWGTYLANGVCFLDTNYQEVSGSTVRKSAEMPVESWACVDHWAYESRA